MKGLEIKFKGATIVAAVENGVVSVVATDRVENGFNETNLHIGGLERTENTHLYWLQEDLKLGDEFNVRVVDVDEKDVSPVKEKKKNRLNRDNEKLKTYHKLKDELEKKGLLNE